MDTHFGDEEDAYMFSDPEPNIEKVETSSKLNR